MKNTFMQRKEDVVRNWYVIDADGVSLGRLAAKVATVLRGKHKLDILVAFVKELLVK